MKYSTAFVGGVIASMALASSAFADSYADQVGKCLTQYANATDAASVTLECTAGGGKLSDCKVLENTAGGKGFDKAALCVASYLPIGAKTGVIKVPVRFPGAG